ncbi:MAG: 4Fe-4S dicluster domain-containing protein [Candidatus Buchananbacteria bacterium]
MLKKDLDKWLKKLLGSFIIYGPVVIKRQILVQKITQVKTVDYSGKLPQNSFKEIFLPAEQEIITYQKTKVETVINQEAKNIIAWGLNVLDLKALTLYEQVFAKDPYYQARRRQILVIGFHPADAVSAKHYKNFALELEDNLLEHLVFDVFIIKHGANFIFYTGTKRGQQFLENQGITDYQHVAFIGPAKEGSIKAQELAGLISKSVNHPVWEKLAKTCLACGKCSAVCPTCYCFDLTEKNCSRCRVAGNCFNSDFGLVAGGNNFQETIKQRIFFWYTHKFVRIPQQYKYAVPGCISCLRCYQVCPVGIDIRKVLAELKKPTTKK